MPIPKKYFHDRIVLLLLSVSVFLAILNTASILVRLLNGVRSHGYIVQCRDCPNITNVDKFKTGGISGILAFIVFGVVVLAIHAILSMRIYQENRQYAITILSMGILLLVLSIIVSNALLVLR